MYQCPQQFRRRAVDPRTHGRGGFMPTGISFVRHCARAVGAGICLAAFGALAQTAAPDPTGEWRVAKGYATMRLVDCNGEIWGVVASEQKPGGIDEKNPDARLRHRPTLGMPVLLGMKQSGRNEWSGDIYNAQDGRTYSAKISLANADTLKVQGCVLGFLCGGENWTRVAAPEANAAPPSKNGANPPAASTSRAPPPNARASANATPPSPPNPETASSEELCSSLLGLAGSSHERRLK
jgi:uncharacterized protein (DUF2147 family)